MPKVSGSHIQSRKSENAIERIFLSEHFISRKEAPDYGVDYRVEIIKDSKATNILFLLQLKSQENAKINVAGEFISCEVEVSALAYLNTNKTGLSLFVAYDDATQIAYGEWVHVLIQELDSRNSGWRAQANVTVRIPTAKVLNPARVMEIHGEVVSHNQNITGVLGNSASVAFFDQTVSSSMNLVSGSPDERLAYLETNGAQLITMGQHYNVIDEYKKIPPVKWLNNARHLLNLASAYDHAGMPLQSLVYAHALIGRDLDANDKINAKLLLLNAQLGLRQISSVDHKVALAALCKENTGNPLIVAIFLQLKSTEIVKQEHREDILKILWHAEKLYSECVTKDISVGFAMHLLLLLGNLQYHGFIALLTHDVHRIRIGDTISRPIPTAQRAAWALEGFKICEKSNLNFKSVIEASQNPFPEMYGRALLMLSESVLFKFAFIKMLPADDLPDSSEMAKACDAALTNIPKIQKIFTSLRLDGQVLETLKHQADILYMVGRTAEAEDLIRTTIVPAAKMLGLPDSAVTPTVFASLEAFRAAQAVSVDETITKLTGDERLKWERQMLALLELPADRMPYFHNEMLAVQSIAKEKSTWCKNIEMIVDLKQHDNPATAFTYAPNLNCACTEFGYESRIATNINPLVLEFKNDYCKNCQKRSL